MKKLFAFFAILVLYSSNSSAQIVRIGALTGLNVANKGLGFNITGDLSYSPKPQLDMGIILGVGVGGQVDSLGKANNIKGGVKYGFQTRYFLKKGKFRPYIGGMATIFSGAGINVKTIKDIKLNGTMSTKIALVPMFGLKIGVLNLNSGYSLGGGALRGFSINAGLLFGFGKYPK